MSPRKLLYSRAFLLVAQPDKISASIINNIIYAVLFTNINTKIMLNKYNCCKELLH